MVQCMSVRDMRLTSANESLQPGTAAARGSEKGSTMTRAAIYCRISLDRDGKGLGVDRQREDCLEIAQDNGWDVPEAHIYIDNDVSASEFSKKAREKYLQLLADI